MTRKETACIPLAAGLFGLFCCAAAAADQAPPMRLLLNGKEYSHERGELPFYPGRPNLLEIRPTWILIGGDKIEIVVTKTLPDRRIEKLTAGVKRHAKHFFLLGPMTAPPVFEFEAGVVYRRGYRLDIDLLEAGSRERICGLSFHQAAAEQALTPERLEDYSGVRYRRYRPNRTIAASGTERLVRGKTARDRYDPMYGTEQALALKLDEAVLAEVNDVAALFRLTPGVCAKLYHEGLDCELVATDSSGRQLVNEKVTLKDPGRWMKKRIDAAGWPAGDYQIALRPVVAEKTWAEGPEVVYRKRPCRSGSVRVSHLAPWTIEKDENREKITITDFHDACSRWAENMPDGWTFKETPSGTALLSPASAQPDPLTLDPGASGWYAVFAKPHAGGCAIRVGNDGLVRSVAGKRPFEDKSADLQSKLPVFVCASELGGSPITIFPYDFMNEPASGLAFLELVPVTRRSAESFYRQTSNPPTPLYGVNDWCDYFHGPCRLAPDQFDAIVGGQVEIGLGTIDWSIGRSWVEYHSELPGVTLFPAVPLDEAAKTFDTAGEYVGREIMINRYRPLMTVLGNRPKLGAAIWPWLAMNRHYGTAYGGIFASSFFLENPQWHRRGKFEPAGAGAIAMSYYFEGVRRERLDIFAEVAAKGPDGLLLGCCRQVPMLLYHPQMVAEYVDKTGIDPRKLFKPEDLDEYKKWIKWRADFFTQFLRDLKKKLEPIRGQTDKPIPVSVRIPSGGLFWNMAEGLDVEQWLREDLVDGLQVDPLEYGAGWQNHDVRPYIELGRKYNVKIAGGIGSTWMLNLNAKSYVPAMRRALGLLDAGVDSIELYEANAFAKCSHWRWITPLFGNAAALREFLAESNIEACYPVSAATAAFGHDNHSGWYPHRPGLPGL